MIAYAEVFADDFAALGLYLLDLLAGKTHSPVFDKAIEDSLAHNVWFTRRGIETALRNIATGFLDSDRLSQWLAARPEARLDRNACLKPLAVVAAGNIPLVCFHDFLSVLASGRRVCVKLSRKDAFLLPALASFLGRDSRRAACWKERISFTSALLPEREGRQAYGGIMFSGGERAEAFYREHYLHTPLLVRTNRISIAVLSSQTSAASLEALSRDCFLYFGRGCRNVSTLLVPVNYDWTAFFRAVKKVNVREGLALDTHPAYVHNYRYAKALAIMYRTLFADGGCFVLSRGETLHPRVACLYFREYASVKERDDVLLSWQEHIQCRIGLDVAFGKAQEPGIDDYADGIDTSKWIASL